jgi:hypothetical protein
VAARPDSGAPGTEIGHVVTGEAGRISVGP